VKPPAAAVHARPASGGAGRAEPPAGQPLVRLGASGGVATVTLARPRMRNALVPELLLDLCVALETAGRRDDVRCVLLLAEGDAFSIGLDLRRLAQEMRGPGLAAYGAELVGLLNQAMLTLMRLRQPVVAAAHGRVGGAALGLLLAADLVVAAEDTRFSAGYAVSGLSPDGGWTALLPRVAGARRAGAGLLLDRAISAAEARDWGLVTELVPADALLPSALGIACRIAASPPATVRNAKRMLQGDVAEVEAALEAERRGFIEAIGSLDARERILRLLEDAPHYPGDTHGPGG
jgi:2-(1,2-epoxy-1,2-dihydrophenyl)acetyl-CoA isomerase